MYRVLQQPEPERDDNSRFLEFATVMVSIVLSALTGLTWWLITQHHTLAGVAFAALDVVLCGLLIAAAVHGPSDG